MKAPAGRTGHHHRDVLSPVLLWVLGARVGEERDAVEQGPIALVNGEIIEREGTVIWSEGCLSLPGVTAEVERSARIVVRYLDAEGIEKTLEADGLTAVCIQHELDHLDGQLYIDRLGLLEKKATIADYDEVRSKVQEPVS